MEDLRRAKGILREDLDRTEVSITGEIKKISTGTTTKPIRKDRYAIVTYKS